MWYKQNIEQQVQHRVLKRQINIILCWQCQGGCRPEAGIVPFLSDCYSFLRCWRTVRPSVTTQHQTEPVGNARSLTDKTSDAQTEQVASVQRQTAAATRPASNETSWRIEWLNANDNYLARSVEDSRPPGCICITSSSSSIVIYRNSTRIGHNKKPTTTTSTSSCKDLRWLASSHTSSNSSTSHFIQCLSHTVHFISTLLFSLLLPPSVSTLSASQLP